LSSRQTGDTGEYYVLYQLVQEGFLAALAPKTNTKTIDILCSTIDGLASTIQVKTRKPGSGSWLLQRKHGDNETPTLFYALVWLKDEEPHDVFILPAAEMARVVRDSFHAYLNTPGRKPKKPDTDPNAQRRIYDPFPVGQYGEVPNCPPGWTGRYRERWDLLREVRVT